MATEKGREEMASAQQGKKALFRVTPQTLMQVTVDTINGRDLHKFLGIKTRYNDWIHRALEYAQMIENKDYVVLLKTEYKSSRGTPNSKEYFLTQRCCEHVGMMADEDKGSEIRDYFIQERDDKMALLKSQAEAPMPSSILERWLLNEPADFVARFQGELAGKINALNTKTKQGIPKLPTDIGSVKVAGVVPNRIAEMYDAFLGTKMYAELKARADRLGAKAHHQVLDELVVVAMTAFMNGLATGAQSNQHYEDMLEAATHNRQLALPYRWPAAQLPLIETA